MLWIIEREWSGDSLISKLFYQGRSPRLCLTECPGAGVPHTLLHATRAPWSVVQPTTANNTVQHNGGSTLSGACLRRETADTHQSRSSRLSRPEGGGGASVGLTSGDGTTVHCSVPNNSWDVWDRRWCVGTYGTVGRVTLGGGVVWVWGDPGVGGRRHTQMVHQMTKASHARGTVGARLRAERVSPSAL